MRPRTEFLLRPDPTEAQFPPTLFALVQRAPRRTDRGALAVQITLCIVVSALLFSVIALPKLRRAQAGDPPGVPAAERSR
jgi:hypothetical protein